MQETTNQHEIPVKVYCSDERVMVAAPMPGLEPQDIFVEVEPSEQLVLHGDLRGEFKGQKEVLADEWSPGPYHRELQLPEPVDGSMANVTYNNGVLVVIMPRAERTKPAHLTLETVGEAKGKRVGHTGSPPQADGAGTRDTNPSGGMKTSA